ncbi:MAG: hypothetical protein IT174_11460 [Acidobacteria bacterium]|nr:hypothetical protein [Acidobacteriota bacterium]
MTRADERKRASELKAVDVREIIRASLPAVLPQLTLAHLDQLQRVLDAAVINADVQRKWEELDRQSIRGRLGNSNQNLRDPAGVAVRDKVLSQKVISGPGDNAIRLDLRKLLEPAALRPTSDNPDEAAYLLVIADVYEHLGVWLLLDSSAGAMTQNMLPNDRRKWRVRLVLGFKPGALIEQIETSSGRLDRRALLSVTRLGAGYYEWVHLGPTMKALKKELDRVSEQIRMGRSEHAWWSLHRTQFNIVSKVSDKLGGADWPNERIWEQPHQVYVQALNLVNTGKLMQAAKSAQLAAFLAGACGRSVHEYLSATTRGASRAVTILEIARVCGEIAEAVLTLIALGQGIIRLLGRKGGAGAVGGQGQLTGGQRQLPAPAEPVRTPSHGAGGGTPKPGSGTVGYGQDTLNPVVRPRPAGREMTNLPDAINHARAKIGLPPLPPKTLAGPLALAEDAQYRKLHKEFMDWLTKNPNASLAEKNARLERVNQARWGASFPTD